MTLYKNTYFILNIIHNVYLFLLEYFSKYAILASCQLISLNIENCIYIYFPFTKKRVSEVYFQVIFEYER